MPCVVVCYSLWISTATFKTSEFLGQFCGMVLAMGMRVLVHCEIADVPKTVQCHYRPKWALCTHSIHLESLIQMPLSDEGIWNCQWKKTVFQPPKKAGLIHPRWWHSIVFQGIWCVSLFLLPQSGYCQSENCRGPPKSL